MKNKVYTYLLLIIVNLFISSCSQESETIKIGILGEFGSINNELTVNVRDGAVLKIESVNEQGGVNGRYINLEIIDIDSNKSPNLIEDLDKEGFDLFIGPVTSAKCSEFLSYAKNVGTTLISPTCSSPIFSGIKDNFFRVCPDTSKNAELYANYVFDELGIRNLSIISYGRNSDFSEPWASAFSNSYTKSGGKIIKSITFSSSEKSIVEIAGQAVQGKPEAYVILAEADHTGLLVQNIHKLDDASIFLTSSWSLTGDLVFYAGHVINNIYSIQNRLYDKSNPTRRLFEESFRKRYRTEPLLAAEFGYEAAQLAVEALEKGSEGKSIKDILPHIAIEGVNGRIEIDEFGDTERPIFVVKFNDNKLKVLKQLR